MMTFESDLKDELARLKQLHKKRNMMVAEKAIEPWLIRQNKKLLNLASNNYLGLAGDIRLKKAAVQAVEQYGTGAAASRLIVGNHPLYEQAEALLTDWKESEAGVIFTSGYTANLGIISAICDRKSIVFSDKLNHASIIDGIILSRAEHKRYRHNDLNHLEELLKKASPDQRKLIVTDSVFSMDGDTALLKDLVTLKERYGAILMVDEAHSTGIYGDHGEGLVHHLKLQGKIDIQMGTFSKALGSFGAYIVGEAWLIEYLLNQSRSFIYTTALPPSILGSISSAIEIVRTNWHLRERLWKNVTYFRIALEESGFDLCGSETQIVPIKIGSTEGAIRFSQRLQEEGVAAIAIRPPTVPENAARIRFSIMATHDLKDLEWAVKKIVLVGKEMGVIA